MIRILCLALLLALPGCATNQSPAVSDDLSLSRARLGPQWPQSIQVYRTTGAEIYLANLDASIASLERLYGLKPSIQTGLPLAGKLYHRFKVLGRLEDAEAALSVIRQVTSEPHASAASFITLANILSGFHLFSEALTSLEQAKVLHGDSAAIARLSTEINIAIGNYEFPTEGDDHLASIAAAQWALLNGDITLAATHFREAERFYSGSDPYVLCWIQLQAGIAFLRYGDRQTARHFFQTAHERLPRHFLATEHLAETELLLGNLQSAEQLYLQVSEQTQNPQFYAQLAKVQALQGHDAASQQSLVRAAAGYDKLLAQYPKIIGDHAVKFYLEQNQGGRALLIAQDVVQNRQNIESWILLARTALVVDDQAEACRAWSAAIKLGVRPVELTLLTGRLENLCN